MLADDRGVERKPVESFIPKKVTVWAYFDGKLYNLPFNMNTFYQLWGVKTPAEAKAKIEEQRKEFDHYRDGHLQYDLGPLREYHRE